MKQIEAIAKSTEAFPVDFDEAWKWVGYSRKDAAKRVLVNNFKEGLDYRMLHSNVEHPVGKVGGTNKEFIHLTTDCFKKFCMMAGTEAGEAVRNYYLECDQELKQTKSQAQPQPQTNADSFIPLPERTGDGVKNWCWRDWYHNQCHEECYVFPIPL